MPVLTGYFLDDIYRNKAHCCVIFISKEYGEKIWTSHERQSAQARALKENKEYRFNFKTLELNEKRY